MCGQSNAVLSRNVDRRAKTEEPRAKASLLFQGLKHILTRATDQPSCSKATVKLQLPFQRLHVLISTHTARTSHSITLPERLPCLPMESEKQW